MHLSEHLHSYGEEDNGDFLIKEAEADDFLLKPFKSAELLKCVERALTRSARQRERAEREQEARCLLDLLTPREFEVLQLLTTGLLNKQVGAELGIAEKTVKVHRGRVTQKLRLNSVAEMVELMHTAGVPPSPR